MKQLTNRDLGLILGALYRAEAWEAEIASSAHNARSVRLTAKRLMGRYADVIEKIQQARKGKKGRPGQILNVRRSTQEDR